MERIKNSTCTYYTHQKNKAMNNFFTSQSTSFLLVMLIIFGVSALIKFAIKLFELIVKLAFVLIILFLGFKALESDDTPKQKQQEPTPSIPDTINAPKNDTLKMTKQNVLGDKPAVCFSNNKYAK